MNKNDVELCKEMFRDREREERIRRNMEKKEKEQSDLELNTLLDEKKTPKL